MSMSESTSDPSAAAETQDVQQDASLCITEKNENREALLKKLESLKLPPARQIAIEGLLRGLSDTMIAEIVGVNRTTIYRWRHDPEFLAEMEEQRQYLWQQIRSRLQAMYGPALSFLEKQLMSDDAKVALRATGMLLRAAAPDRLERAQRSAVREVRRAHVALEEQQWASIKSYIDTPQPGEPAYQRRKEQLSNDEHD